MSGNSVSEVMGPMIENYRLRAEAISVNFNVQSGACPMQRTPTMEMAQNLVDQSRYLNGDMRVARYVAGGFSQEQMRTIDQANPVAAYLQNSCGITPGGMKR